MIDAALSLLALAACSDLLLQFARVRGWHPADVFQNALYVLFALPALTSLILAFASPPPAVLAVLLLTLFSGAGAWLGAVISAPRALQRPAVLGLLLVWLPTSLVGALVGARCCCRGGRLGD